MISIPSLDQLIPASVPYTVRGAIIRGVRGVISAVVSFAAVGLANGTILQSLHLSPEISVLIAATLTPAVQAVDKYLREKGFEDDVTTDPIPVEPPPTTPPPPVTPAPTSDDGVDLGPAPDPVVEDGTVDGNFPQP